PSRLSTNYMARPGRRNAKLAGQPVFGKIQCVSPSVAQTVDAVYRADSRRILATLIRLLGDFDLAEDALHDAFAAALKHWPEEGVPANPRAWLVSTGRFKAIDALRRRVRPLPEPEFPEAREW